MQNLMDYLDTTAILTRVVEFLPRLFYAGAVLVVFWVILKITRRPLRTVLRKSEFSDPLIKLLIDNVYKFTVIGLGIVMAVSQLGVNVGAALAGIGVVGIAVGFAAQESVANTIAGFLIFWDKPFQVGHYITTQGEYGEVTNITMRTTRIKTPRNTYIVIPNRKIIEDVLINHSLHGCMRLDVSVGVAYKEDIAAAREALIAAVNDLSDVLSEPAPEVVVVSLGDSSVNLEVRVWVENAANELPLTFRILEASKIALDRAGIEIPFPHLQLFVDEVKQPAADRLREAFAAR